MQIPVSGEQLLSVAKDGIVEELIRLLESGEDVNYSEDANVSANIKIVSGVDIISNSHVFELKLIIFSSFQLNTALHWASSEGFNNCVEVLLAHPNININAKNTVSNKKLITLI